MHVRLDGCLAAALRARVLGRSVSQSVTSPMGSVKSGAAVQTSLGHVRSCQAISFRSGTAAGHHLFVATTSAPSRSASLAQLAEHALRKRMVVGSIPTGGLVTATEAETDPGLNYCCWQPMLVAWTQLVYFGAS